jgi:hypothetical protein
MMARRFVRDDGVRQALIPDAQRSAARWAISGRPSERLEVLRSGVPVVVSSACLLTAFSRAGLPVRDYCFGGRHWGKAFLLDEFDQLTEWGVE